MGREGQPTVVYVIGEGPMTRDRAELLGYVGGKRPVQKRRMRDSVLTITEITALQWTADGKRYAEVADLMAITDNAVGLLLHSAMNKLGAATGASAVAIGIRRRIIR